MGNDTGKPATSEEFLSPAWIRKRGDYAVQTTLARAESALAASSATTFLFLAALCLEGFLLVYFQNEAYQWASRFSHQLGWALWPLSYALPVLGTILVFLPLSFYAPEEAKSALSFFVYLISFVLLLQLVPKVAVDAQVVLCFLSPLLLPALVLSPRLGLEGKSKLVAFLLTGSSVIAIWAWTLLDEYGATTPSKTLSLSEFRFIGPKISRAFMFFSVLSLVLGMRVGLREKGAYTRFIFQPAHFFGPFPALPQAEPRPRSMRLIISGLLDMHVALLFLILLFIVSSFFDFLLEGSSWGVLGYGMAGAERYLQYYFGSCIILYFCSASLRLMGIPVHDPENWPLLASSPLDRWRRWTIYHYDWLMAFVFLPLRQRIGGQFIPILGVFAFSFVSHVDFELFFWILFLSGKIQELPIEVSLTLKSKLLFFFLHGLSVYICLKLPFLCIDDQKRRSWLGVMAVFLIMSFIHLTTVFRASDFSSYFIGF